MSTATLTPVEYPELWQPGDVEDIPTVLGVSYSCTITRELYAERNENLKENRHG